MSDQGMVYLWGLVIFVLLSFLLTFVLMEFSLDKKKKEKDGTLRVKKNGFVIRFVYKTFLSIPFSHNPKNLCQLFWGIFFGFLGNCLIFLCVWGAGSLLIEIFKTVPIFHILKPFFGTVVMIAVVFMVVFLFIYISSVDFMPATKEWLKAKKKKICPIVKLVN